MAQVKEYDEKKMALIPVIDRENPSRKYTEKEEKYLREMITCEFYNSEEPGLSLKFTYGSTRNKMSFEFYPSGRYKIPRFIQRHVESCSKPQWAWKPDGTGRLTKYIKGQERRFTMREVI